MCPVNTLPQICQKICSALCPRAKKLRLILMWALTKTKELASSSINITPRYWRAQLSLKTWALSSRFLKFKMVKSSSSINLPQLTSGTPQLRGLTRSRAHLLRNRNSKLCKEQHLILPSTLILQLKIHSIFKDLHPKSHLLMSLFNQSKRPIIFWS